MIRAEKVLLRYKIEKSFHKHRGDLEKVIAETNLSKDYVLGVLERLRRKSSQDVRKMVVDQIMETIMSGYRSRVAHLTETLEKFEGRENILLSLCCNAPVGVGMNGKYYCDKCKRETTVVIATQEMIIKLKQGILNQLRQEDIVLVACAEKMRYTDKFSSILPIQSNKITRSVSLIPEINQLNPMAMQALLSKISEKLDIESGVKEQPDKEQAVETKQAAEIKQAEVKDGA